MKLKLSKASLYQLAAMAVEYKSKHLKEFDEWKKKNQSKGETNGKKSDGNH